MVRWAQVSPDGQQVVFELLGKLWMRPADGGSPRRLTRGNEDSFEAWPSWSRDGRSITFVGWNDARLGGCRRSRHAADRPEIVTTQPGHYRSPRFSPDGRTIVMEAGSGGFLTSDQWGRDAGVYAVPASGGKPKLVLRGAAEPAIRCLADRLFTTHQTKRTSCN